MLTVEMSIAEAMEVMCLFDSFPCEFNSKGDKIIITFEETHELEKLKALLNDIQGVPGEDPAILLLAADKWLQVQRDQDLLL